VVQFVICCQGRITSIDIIWLPNWSVIELFVFLVRCVAYVDQARLIPPASIECFSFAILWSGHPSWFNSMVILRCRNSKAVAYWSSLVPCFDVLNNLQFVYNVIVLLIFFIDVEEKQWRNIIQRTRKLISKPRYHTFWMINY
jgi:hypothetical protein